MTELSRRVRTRFAPSPTGGLHLGGVRTALFTYLFAKKHKGDFILRIEDTDQARFVAGAEQYIEDCLSWCGLHPDESPSKGGSLGPYRQSERKAMYQKFAAQLVKDGHAYYAFDTAEELEAMRAQHNDFQYGYHYRDKMRNSLTLGADEVQKLLADKTPHVVRIKIPRGETITMQDMIRGEISFESDTVDDKVLLKADGMATYHLAVVVDDYHMQISHTFRGEEWLPSSPVHILLWQYLGWADHMPQWAHLPLILNPSGHGKLSKRDSAKLGFPIFAMDWTDKQTGELTQGFKERGFLAEGFVNYLALLGWNPGTEQEIFSLAELIDTFSMERVHKGGAQFDYEKAKWFNSEWIKNTSADVIAPLAKPFLQEKGLMITDNARLTEIIGMIKERCTLLSDIYDQSFYLFTAPTSYDWADMDKKWTADKAAFFAQIQTFITDAAIDDNFEKAFKDFINTSGQKLGEIMPIFRIMLVGSKSGPDMFKIVSMLGKDEVLSRVTAGLRVLKPAIA